MNAQQLTEIYTKRWVNDATKLVSTPPKITGPRTAQFARTIHNMASKMDEYRNDNDAAVALEHIDLGKIYAGVDKREQEGDGTFGYDDYVVMELLNWFKNDFFTWVNKPKCPQCQCDGDNIEPRGGRPWSGPNPDHVAGVEVYHCRTCNHGVEFSRIKNPITLLRTREGRCGEWVDCFLLVLVAVLGDVNRVRFVWNQEDHVWCEYYSTTHLRWIHLDPCEASFDQPHLYCDNWGKEMTWVVAFGIAYCIDVSSKYITPQKSQPKSSVVDSVRDAENAIRWCALSRILTQPDVYPVVVQYNRERVGPVDTTATKSGVAPVGRQSGSAEWTASRGEAGHSRD